MPGPSAFPPAGRLRVTYAGVESGGESAMALPVRWLAGATEHALFAGAESAGETNGFHAYEAGGLRIGHAADCVAAGEIETTTAELYRRMFQACGGRRFYRVWNYVPAINATEGGIENYRAFCRGRALAFEREFGAGFERELPAASAVGAEGGELHVIFAAGGEAGRHVENPEQLPAYRYPAEHGPRSPSFARATVAGAGGRRYAFVSGTAAIKGHASVAPGDLEGQLACTLDNLRLISRAAGLGERLRFGGGRSERHFKVYLREAADLTAARAVLERELLEPEDRVSYLQANICRAELKVEIEATVVR
ncbi:MAG TPA: hypothetical protein VG710_19000 [Opitutus sp.]|nr:hypothetical protein [Opitutus sp.]